MAVEQEVATFFCQHTSCDAITFRVNGTSNSTISTSIINTRSASNLSLSIATLLEYNKTTVECVAIFYDGSLPLFTPPVMLLIQGIVVHV